MPQTLFAHSLVLLFMFTLFFYSGLLPLPTDNTSLENSCHETGVLLLHFRYFIFVQKTNRHIEAACLVIEWENSERRGMQERICERRHARDDFMSNWFEMAENCRGSLHHLFVAWIQFRFDRRAEQIKFSLLPPYYFVSFTSKRRKKFKLWREKKLNKNSCFRNKNH